MAGVASPKTEREKGKTSRRSLDFLKSQLKLERSSFDSHYRDLGENILPRRLRFDLSENNRGDKRHNNIYDNSALSAARTLSAGLMSGVTSPARDWFKLASPDITLNENEEVKQWTHIVQKRMHSFFLRSNLYNKLPIVYKDMGVFGTSALFIEEDFDSLMRVYTFPIGSYWVGTDPIGRVNKFCREIRMTVDQVVEKFGRIIPNDRSKIVWDNISDRTRSLFENGNTEAWIDVTHIIRPNPFYNPNKKGSKFKKYQSVYYEFSSQSTSGSQQSSGIGVDDHKLLMEDGYDYFPVLCPRWELSGEDVYGTNCPGMTALGDVKQLQLGERRALQAIEKMVNPPLTGPTSLKKQAVSHLPGDITYYDVREGQQGLRSLYEVNFRLDQLEGKQQQTRERISRAFYEDLFLMLAQSDRRQITAREIEERHEEKLLALGPVLEQLNQDLLDPLIDIAFILMEKQGYIPEPPDAIQGAELRVEYISIMSQAQKLVGIATMDRFVGTVGNMASIHPSVLEKINGDQVIDQYGEMLSVPPGIIRSDEEVASSRQAQAEAQAQQAQAEQAVQMAKASKDLAQAPMEGDNALKRMIEGG